MTPSASSRDVPALHGDSDPGFGQVVDAFRDNFRDRGDCGAGCTVYVDGRTVVDVWAGTADARTGREWDGDTAAALFSCTKAIVALCAYLLVQEEKLDLDVPVARYWPRFAQAGKETVTMRQILAHRAGLPAVETNLTRAQVCDWDTPVHALESQGPMWVPGTAHSYHPVTYGWLAGEVIRRITGLTPGRFFRRAVADPLNLKLWIGLPPSARPLIAWMEPPLADDDSPIVRQMLASQATSKAQQAMTAGEALPFPTENGIVTMNDPVLQDAELPGINGIGTARSLARLYAACIGDLDGAPRLLTDDSVADASIPRSWGQMLLGDPDRGQRWGTGFMLSSPPARPMLSGQSFGHDGAGGQLGFADPTYRVGFAYLSRQMGPLLDERANVLVRALGRCLGAPEPLRTPAVPSTFRETSEGTHE